MSETRPLLRPIGLELLPTGQVLARIWAPYAQQVGVSIVLEGGPGAGSSPVPLAAEDRGYFSGIVPGAAAGTRYRVRLGADDALAADPASRFQPEGVHGPSEVVDPAAFPWEMERWHVPPLRDWVIYEIHVGAFTPEGTFEAVIPHLPYLKDLGITTIEIMPVAQSPGARNWGYDGVFPYAPQHSYGGPDGLRRLVDAAHRAGLAVILDVVYNHLGPEGNILHRYGPYFTDRYHTPWGDAINFDGPGSDEVRAFFIDNALMWLEEYRIDGFRLDAVQQIFDAHAQPFLAELANAVHGRAAVLGRPAILIAESDLNDPKLILPPAIGGYALDGQWADDFHHALEVQLSPETSGYRADYGDFTQLATALRQAFVYTGQYSPSRQRSFGRSPEPAQRDQFIVFQQNHDQVGNRPGGERLGHRITFPERALAAATVLLSPFVPLLFMGEEYGELAPFLYFTDHGDPDLIEGVRAGRREEFAHWDWDDAAPDPQDPATFQRSTLNLELHKEGGEHQALFEVYRALLTLRRELPPLTDPHAAREVTVLEAERIIVIYTAGYDSAGDTLTVLSFSETATPITLPVPEGTWTKRFDTGDARFLGGGPVGPNRLDVSRSLEITLPPHAALLYQREAT